MKFFSCFRVVQGVEQAEILLAHQLIRLQVEEGPVEHFARNVAQGVDHEVDVDLLHPVGEHVVGGLEVDRGHHGHQVLDLLRVQRRVAQRESAALADAEDVDLGNAMAFADDIDAAVQIAVDVVVEGQVAVGAIRVAPVDQVDVLAGGHQCLDGRAVFLDVGHVRAVDQGVDDQQRHLAWDLVLGLLEAEQGELVFMIDHRLRGDAGG
jgi:hypothetical protein